MMIHGAHHRHALVLYHGTCTVITLYSFVPWYILVRFTVITHQNLKMVEVIEVDIDGSFDLSSAPVEVISSIPDIKPQARHPATKDWEIKKQRGSEAFSAGHLELAGECYTAALHSLEVQSCTPWLINT